MDKEAKHMCMQKPATNSWCSLLGVGVGVIILSFSVAQRNSLKRDI